MERSTNQLPTPSFKEEWKAPYQCYYCNAHGHKATSCRKKIRERRARQNNKLKQLKKEEAQIASKTQEIVLTLLKEINHLKTLIQKFWTESSEKEILKDEKVDQIEKELKKQKEDLINQKKEFKSQQSEGKKDYEDQKSKFQEFQEGLQNLERWREGKDQKEKKANLSNDTNMKVVMPQKRSVCQQNLKSGQKVENNQNREVPYLNRSSETLRELPKQKNRKKKIQEMTAATNMSNSDQREKAKSFPFQNPPDPTPIPQNSNSNFMDQLDEYQKEIYRQLVSLKKADSKGNFYIS